VVDQVMHAEVTQVHDRGMVKILRLWPVILAAMVCKLGRNPAPLSWGAYQRQLLVGSLAGAAHLLNSNIGVLRKAQ